LIGATPCLSYPERVNLLLKNQIALWDVLKSCQRSSSLDADIIQASQVVNDFAGLLLTYTRIEHIFFNGSAAEQTFRRHVLTQMKTKNLKLYRLPSTSPALASLTFEEKLNKWEIIREPLQPSKTSSNEFADRKNQAL
jgi:double-stranded uracil-DNA glycosylase